MIVKLYTTFFLLCLLHAAHAQVSVTQETAGVGPTPDSPQFPSGLNGLSTGSTVQFTALGTGATPNNIPRPTNTLTGEALSAFEASIATNAAQASGSNFGYTSTTGNQISGVANTLSGGYNEVSPVLGGSSSAGASSASAGNGNAAGVTVTAPKANAMVVVFISMTVAMLGAVIVL